MRVSVPASTANLGPGFDCLAIALEERFHLDVGEPHRPSSVSLSERHPATVGFRRAGGDGDVFGESSIAPGKGMGYSGAAHVAGLAAGFLSRFGWIDHPQVALMAASLEGHADNASASLFGGVTVASGERVVRLRPPAGVSVVMWIPAAETSTSTSRQALPTGVPFDDAVASVGHAALMVAALASGDLDAVRTACVDVLHQPTRLAEQPESAAAIEAALSLSATVGAWLSGSGPSVAVMVRSGDVPEVAAGLPATGHVKTLAIATNGVAVHAGAD